MLIQNDYRISDILQQSRIKYAFIVIFHFQNTYFVYTGKYNRIGRSIRFGGCFKVTKKNGCTTNKG